MKWNKNKNKNKKQKTKQKNKQTNKRKQKQKQKPLKMLQSWGTEWIRSKIAWIGIKTKNKNKPKS